MCVPHHLHIHCLWNRKCQSSNHYDLKQSIEVKLQSALLHVVAGLRENDLQHTLPVAGGL